MISLTDHQVRVARMRAQGLIERDHRPPAALLTAMAGAQAQDLGAGYLSLRARDSGLTAEALDQARGVERTISWGWCMRGTLHLCASEDLRWLVPLLGPKLIVADRGRMRQLGWDEENTQAGLTLLRDALERDEGLTRAEIRRRLQTAGLPWEGQAAPHLIYRAALEGLLVPGPGKGQELRYVSFKRWIGPPLALERSEALARLARCYPAAFGPAAPEDLAAWSGLNRSQARQAWDQIGGERVDVQAGGKPAWMPPGQLEMLQEDRPPDPLVRLLPAWDTLLLGYADRDWVVEPADTKRVYPGGGLISAVLLVDGQARGTWKIHRLTKRIEIQVTPFQTVSSAVRFVLENEAAEIGRFLGQDARLVIAA